MKLISFSFYLDFACPYPKEYNLTDNLMHVGYNLSSSSGNNNSPLIAFGDQVEYVCRDGMKFEADMLVASQNATCNVTNTWEPSSSAFWSVCVPSKY